ncbi:MAG: LamG-like jellyroll fold domain-containing protein, partial [Terriglobales bacterium]
QLASEVESYSGSGSTCSVVAWVLVGTLSVTSNGTVYIAVGNTSPPARTSGLWTTAGYSDVYHLANGTTLSGADATGNLPLTVPGGYSATAGQIDGATTGATSYSAMATATNVGITGASPWTMSAWASFSGTQGSNGVNNLIVWGPGTSNYNTAELCMYQGKLTAGATYYSSEAWIQTSFTPSNNTWYYYTVSYDGTTLRIYENGTLAGSGAMTLAVTNTPLYVGSWSSSNGTGWSGAFDEVELSASTRSTSWITAEYNNQASPGNIGSPGFWTWGAFSAFTPVLSVSSCLTATLGTASAACTLTLSGGTFNGTTNTVSLADSVVPTSLGGLFTITGGSPSSFTGSGTVTPSAGTSLSFTYTPAVIGPRTITVTDNIGPFPSPWTMTVTSSTPCTFTMTGSGTQSIAATSGWTSTGGCGHSSPTSGDSLVATASGGTLTITVPNDGVVHALGTCPAANTTYDLQLTAVAAGSAVFDVQPGAKFYFCGNRLLTSVVTSLSSTPTVWADLKYETGATVYEDEAQASYAHRTTTSATGEWVRLLWGSSGDTCTFGPGAAYSCPTNVQAVNLGAVNPVVYDPGSTSDSHLFKIYGTGVTGGCGSAAAGCLNYASYGSSVSPYADAGAIYLGGDVFDTTGTVQAPTTSFEPTTRLQVSGTHFVNDLFGFAYNGDNNGTEGYLGSSLASCNISGNYFSAMVGNSNQTLSACVFSGNVFAEGIYVAWNASSLIPTFSNNVDLVSNVHGWGVNFSLTAPVLNNYFGYLDNSSSNHLLGTMTTNDYYRGNVFEGLYTGLGESHCTSTNQVGTNTVILLDNLSVMSPHGNNSCQMYGWDQTGSLPVAWVDHNGAFGNAVYSWLIFLSHTTYIATNQVLRSLRANIGWSPSAGGSNFGVIGTQAGTAANVPSNLAYVPNEAYNAWYNPAASATYGAGVDTNCNPSTSL